jgi:hypothetical protein
MILTYNHIVFVIMIMFSVFKFNILLLYLYIMSFILNKDDHKDDNKDNDEDIYENIYNSILTLFPYVPTDDISYVSFLLYIKIYLCYPTYLKNYLNI